MKAKGAVEVSDLQRDAHAVLFPAFDLPFGQECLTDLLRSGTVALIVGEKREEYVSRSMSEARRKAENPDNFVELTATLRSDTDGPVLIAVDQEPWGIQRLHSMVPEFPSPTTLPDLTSDEIVSAACELASAALKLGVNAFLSPVLDKLCGGNPWLEGRTLDLDHDEIARIAVSFVVGIQQAGVLAVPKHFPGFPRLDQDPAVHDTRVISGDWDARSLIPFREVAAAGAAAMMIGPAIVTDVDADEPATTSRLTVQKLRDELGFTGVVVSDDLDAPATARDRSVEETAVASLMAGADLLLIPGRPEVSRVAQHLAAVAVADPSVEARLRAAAGRVRALVDSTTRGGQSQG
jgi:beta-N-acetylhexosaminidase